MDIFQEILTRIGSTLAVAFFLSVIIERSLAVVFDYRWYKAKLAGKGLKVPIAFAFSFLTCVVAKIDIVAAVAAIDNTFVGYVVTALMVSGGAKKFGQIYGDLRKTESGGLRVRR